MMNAGARHSGIDVEMRIHGDAQVGWIWLDKASDSNAIDRDMAQALSRTVGRLARNGAARAIVLAARGDTFSCGAEIGWLRDQASAPLNAAMDDMRRLAQMLQALAECGIPTIARVQGLAMGMGAGLAAACDICIAAEDAIFHITDNRTGMLPAVVSPYLVRAIGERQCRRYFQTAESFGAARARELGLAHEVARRADLDRRIDAMVASLLACDPLSQASASSLIRMLTAPATAPDSVMEALLRAGAKLRSRPSADVPRSPPPTAAMQPAHAPLFSDLPQEIE